MNNNANTTKMIAAIRATGPRAYHFRRRCGEKIGLLPAAGLAFVLLF